MTLDGGGEPGSPNTIVVPGEGLETTLASAENLATGVDR